MRLLVRALCAAGFSAVLGGCGSNPTNENALGGGPVYAVMYEVFDVEASSSYLALFNSLDIDAIDPKTTREFPGGRAFLQTFNEWLFIGDPTSPIVRRYTLSPEGRLTNERELSFGNYGLEAGVIDNWGHTLVSGEKAYLFDYKEGTTIIWNPTTMEILGEIAAPAEFFREGLNIGSSPAVVRDGKLFRTVFWVNFDTAEYTQEQLLAVYDTENDEYLGSTIEERCPATENLVHQDEDGNFYFSNWIWTIAGTLMANRKPSCVLKLPADSDEFDPTWTLSYAELSGGHEGAVFSYLGDGQGLVSIFDDSQTSFDDMTDPWELMERENWELWTVDLETGSGAPLAGIPPNQGAYTPVTIDGRTFLMVPSDGWGTMTTYELTDGGAVPSIEIPGWSYAFVKVRD